jgi:transcriptional regulator with XRE-family HTH domain
MDENRVALGRAVRDARVRLGMTQNQLSDAAGLARATVQKLERGEGVRSVSLAKIEKTLGWAAGSSQAILDGAGAPVEISPVGAGIVLAKVPEAVMEQAVASALVAVVDTMTASEIRDVSRRAMDELRQRGLF